MFLANTACIMDMSYTACIMDMHDVQDPTVDPTVEFVRIEEA